MIGMQSLVVHSVDITDEKFRAYVRQERYNENNESNTIKETPKAPFAKERYKHLR